MKRWLIAVAAGALVTAAWADDGARVVGVNPAIAAAHSAAAAGKTSKKAGSAKSATRHRKKASKAATRLGLKAHAVK